MQLLFFVLFVLLKIIIVYLKQSTKWLNVSIRRISALNELLLDRSQTCERGTLKKFLGKNEPDKDVNAASVCMELTTVNMAVCISGNIPKDCIKKLIYGLRNKTKMHAIYCFVVPGYII